MSRIDLPAIYNPASQTRQELIDSFVVRLELFHEIFQEIQSSDMKHQVQHYIIQGIRGQGKTTFLWRLAYEIQIDQDLNKWLLPVVFSEEQYSVRKLFKLWELTAEYLHEQPGFGDLYEKMQNLTVDDDYEQNCFLLLENRLKKEKKKLVLFIDNINDMLDKFTKKECQRLREVLIQTAEIRFIGASSLMLEFHHEYDKPFYQFFRMPQLKGLSIQETNNLLLKLGELYKSNKVKEIVTEQPGRIEALRRLTGGVIRTLILLFNIFVDEEDGNAFNDLENVLDKVTPLYKHRMDSLSAQQQEIVDFIALSWDAVSTKEISQKTKEQSKAVSAQLKLLVKNNLIEVQDTNTKNNYYRLSERFFNIWYLMRHGGKKEENKVKWLVEFLQVWCDKGTLEYKARKLIDDFQSGLVCEKRAYYMTEALARTPINRELQDQMFKAKRSYSSLRESDYEKNLEYSDSELKEIATNLYMQNKIEDSFSYIEKIRKKTIDELKALGAFYGFKHHAPIRAEAYYKEAEEMGDVEVIESLGLLYHREFKDKEKAERYYKLAIKKGCTTSIFYLGYLYHSEFKDFEKAIKHYLKAIDHNIPEGMFSLAILYQIEFQEFNKAEKYYLMADENGADGALNTLSRMLYENILNKKKALKYAEKLWNLDKDCQIAYTYASILLWNNEIEESLAISKEFLVSQEAYDKFPEDISQFLMLLIAKKQYNSALKIFNENPFQLKDRFKPLYYALMFFLQKEYPNEYIKMGGELKQTVEEIIDKINEMAVKYKS
ncbi:MAG: sel1 repeat family protein [Candidatus Cloacimonetes bacterium]|nr:sel1 repeat family protein [Candidatus Cloacimonadota bacterium]